jgi:hypothetical protein
MTELFSGNAIFIGNDTELSEALGTDTVTGSTLVELVISKLHCVRTINLVKRVFTAREYLQYQTDLRHLEAETLQRQQAVVDPLAPLDADDSDVDVVDVND